MQGLAHKHRTPRHSFKKPEPVRDTREQEAFAEGWAVAGRVTAEVMLAAKGVNRG